MRQCCLQPNIVLFHVLFEGSHKHSDRSHASYLQAEADSLHRCWQLHVQQDLLGNHRRSDDRRPNMRQYLGVNLLDQLVGRLQVRLALLSLSFLIGSQQFKGVLRIFSVGEQRLFHGGYYGLRLSSGITCSMGLRSASYTAASC